MLRIEKIEIRNYRLFRHVKLPRLPQLTVVVGANGSGKSTLFDVFTFLKDSLTHNVAVAVARRGGFRELVSRGQEGPIAITVQFRDGGRRWATYVVRIVSREGHVVVDREVLRYRRRRYGKAWSLVDFRCGEGYAITNESAYGQEGVEPASEEYDLDNASVLAIKGLGQFRRFRVVSEVRRLIENWHTSTIGDDVGRVAQFLYRSHPDCLDRVCKAMSDVVPGVNRVEARPTEDGRFVLRFQDRTFRDPFVARFGSDGTTKMFAYLTLLHGPKPHPLLAVEEPENHLHPDLLLGLVEEFRDYARRGGQVFVSTHSPFFLNGAGLHEVYWLAKEDGFAQARRAATSQLVKELVKEGDQLGSLWRQGLFAGAGSQLIG